MGATVEVAGARRKPSNTENASLVARSPDSTTPTSYETCERLDTTEDLNLSCDPLPRGTMTWVDAALFIVGELAGAGLLALSEAISNTGVIGVALILCCASAAAYTGNLLGRTWVFLEGQHTELVAGPIRQPYAEMGRRTYGSWMGRIILTLMNVTLFGTSVVLLLVSSELVQEMVSASLSLCSWILFLAILMTPVTWLGSPKHLKAPAMFALGSILVAAVLMVAQMIVYPPDFTPEVPLTPSSLPKFCLGLSTIMFSFTGVSTFPTIQLDMQDRTKLSRAAAVGFFGLCMVYVPVAVAGYVTYGDRVLTNVTYNFTPGPLLTIIQVLLIVHYLGALVMLINPVCQNLEEALRIPYSDRLSRKRVLVRSTLMLVALFVAETVPSFGKIMNLIGGTFTLMLTFILPSLLYIRMRGEYRGSSKHGYKKYIFKRFYLVLVILMCLLLSGFVVYYSVYDIVAPGTFQMPCYINAFM